MALCTIVGMGSGIGLSVAQKFGSEGFDIAMISRNEEHLENYHALLQKQGTYSSYATADAGNFEQLQTALREVGKNTSVLIYNAAVVEKSNVPKLSGEKLSCDFRVNVGGALVTANHVLPSMLERKKGTILFTGGSFSHHPNPAYISLSVGKAGLWNLGMCLAQQYEGLGIHVAIVSVYGKVAAGTRYDPDIIAEEFWKLYMQPRTKWEREVHMK